MLHPAMKTVLKDANNGEWGKSWERGFSWF